jgi:nucleoid DNA-binding protein
MEKMIRSIEALLKRYDYVIIPDLGGFVLQNQSAVIYKNSIEPPISTISFNPLMNVSDGLLAIEISRAEKISFREAMQLIYNETAKIKSQLLHQKTVEFGNLGSLTSNSEGKIIFNPSSNYRFLPANFGLETLHYVPFQKSKENGKRVIQITIPSAATFAKYAAAAAIVAGLFIGTPKLTDAYRNYGSLNPSASLHTSASMVEASKKPTSTPKTVAIAQTKSVETTQQPSFHVIVSCMNTQKEADEYCNRLKSIHFEHVKVLPSKKVFRIAVESFVSENEAYAYKDNLVKTKPQFSYAWILGE